MRNAARIGAVLAAVILLNILLRVVPFPDVSLDVPAWIHTVVRVKNWLLLVVVVLVIVGVAMEDNRRRSD